MASDRVQDALNEQVKHELYAAYLYLSMMNWFEAEALPGFAHWMRHQAEEELAHAMKIVDFINDRGGRVELEAIEKPPVSFGTPLEAMEAALEHEREVTGRIDDLYELARSEGDHPAEVMLQWFVTEQVEEEKSAGDIVDQLHRADGSGGALMVLDQRLGAREA